MVADSSVHPEGVHRVDAVGCRCLSGGAGSENRVLLWSWPTKSLQRGKKFTFIYIYIHTYLFKNFVFFRLLCWPFKRRAWRLQPLNTHTSFRLSAEWGRLSVLSKSTAIRQHPANKSVQMEAVVFFFYVYLLDFCSGFEHTVNTSPEMWQPQVITFIVTLISFLFQISSSQHIHVYMSSLSTTPMAAFVLNVIKQQL